MADTIDTLLALDDKALMEKIGLGDKVKTFREDLQKAAKLKDDARKSVVKHLDKMFEPQSYMVEDLGWKVKEAERKEKTGSSPSEIASCCCGMPGDYD